MALAAHNPFWQQTMLRIKDPKVSVPFYQELFGVTLVDEYHFPQWNFSVYFLATLPEGVVAPAPGTDEAHAFLWSTDLTTLELTHNHGAEEDAELKYNNGNVEPHRGFGHIAFNTEDVYAACEKLAEKGVQFQKKPDEGRMKGLAFALDPDGWWIEIVKRNAGCTFKHEFNLSQTMLRVKDVQKSLRFYRDVMGMDTITEKHFESAKFSLYFLANKGVGGDVPESAEELERIKYLFHPVLELTHNHGTEHDDSFSYHNGNTEPVGFGHIGFLVDDLDGACAKLEEAGYEFKKKPTDGNMRNIAFVYDPDRYLVELIQRGATSF
eukprot:TRINITY_DN4571_c0_g1_i2.p1 TRINITY_DN4571_c0_g1~~TRINITY_DN4571_c0_g1_i2.p1  ORF type:complete len:348 (+),score=100.22 TRINITY_DN4571_c0_g1_i2:76-1044(+)